MNKYHSVIVYGQSTVGKTSFLGLLVRELLARHPGKKARLVTAEHYNAMQDLIDDGLVDAWKVNTRAHPFQCVRRAVGGYWPTDVSDPTSKLVVTPDMSAFPIRIFEGASTFSNYIAGSSVEGALAHMIGKGKHVMPSDNKDGDIQWMDDEEGIGGISRYGYGFIQKEMTSVIQRSQMYPGYSIWTSHEDDVKEKKGGLATGKNIIGPEVFGGALTATISREFADVFHIVRVQVEEGVERRLYLRDHLDNGSLAIARNSAPLPLQSKVPDFIRLSEKNGLPRLDAAKVLLEKLPTF